MQVNDILAEADQHLWGGLSADATIDVGLTGKVVVEMPDVSDRIAEEDNSILVRRSRAEFCIGFAVAPKLAEVVEEYGDAARAILVESGETSGWDGGSLWRSLRWLLRECR